MQDVYNAEKNLKVVPSLYINAYMTDKMVAWGATHTRREM